MTRHMKIMTVIGTRPELIRLSRILVAFEDNTDHTLVHTGQNYDFNLNQIFFDDLGIKPPDYYLNVDVSSLGAVLGDTLRGTEAIIQQRRPDAMVVLGDTNSAISAVIARRMKVPVYHLEAGNRSFDSNVPEEINRHLIDHVADYNMVYSAHSRSNLLAEGLHPSRVIHIGSPMREVLHHYGPQIEQSDILTQLGLTQDEYAVASVHREESVDSIARLRSVLTSLEAVAADQDIPVLISTHPRTRARIAEHGLTPSSGLILHEPFGFHDYVKLQLYARCVVSDSGTISEESTILGFPAVTIRDAIERPEALDTGGIITTGLDPDNVVNALRITLKQHATDGPTATPDDYTINDTSRRVLNFIFSTALTHHMRDGVRIH